MKLAGLRPVAFVHKNGEVALHGETGRQCRLDFGNVFLHGLFVEDVVILAFAPAAMPELVDKRAKEPAAGRVVDAIDEIPAALRADDFLVHSLE